MSRCAAAWSRCVILSDLCTKPFDFASYPKRTWRFQEVCSADQLASSRLGPDSFASRPERPGAGLGWARRLEQTLAGVALVPAGSR